jgi:hypothetical protein
LVSRASYLWPEIITEISTVLLSDPISLGFAAQIGRLDIVKETIEAATQIAATLETSLAAANTLIGRNTHFCLTSMTTHQNK